MKLLLLSLFFASQALAEKVRYDNYEVYRVIPKTREAADALYKIQEDTLGFDFWTSVTGVGNPVDVMVPPALAAKLDNVLASGDFSSTLLIKNVQQLIDNEQPANATRANTRINFEEYQTLDEIYDWLRELDATDERVTLINIGQTFEGRDILGVKLVFEPGNENRSVFLEGTIHAREWISGATLSWVLNEFLTSDDPELLEVVHSRDWFIFPVTNPDGYAYTHATNRMWRKTRVPYYGCYGTDPNRNWPFHWRENGGSSPNPCTETYSGPIPFSELNTRHLSAFITSIAHLLEGYIAFHSYSQFLLLPYGHSDEHLDNYDELYDVGVKAMESLESVHGTEYKVGNIVDLLYVATGSSMDWVKGVYGTPITYTYELRDTGEYGFVLPADQIIATAEETLASLITIFQEFEKILRP